MSRIAIVAALLCAGSEGWGGEDWCVLMRLLEDVTGDRVRSRG